MSEVDVIKGDRNTSLLGVPQRVEPDMGIEVWWCKDRKQTGSPRLCGRAPDRKPSRLHQDCGPALVIPLAAKEEG